MKKKVIGITGGVGSGKSVVLDLLQKEYGAKIISMDTIGAELMRPGEVVYERICAYFGQEVQKDDHTLDRGKLAEIIFANQEKKEKLNGIVHPCVVGEVQNRLSRESGLWIVETALPQEGKLSLFCHEIWYVHVPEEIRTRRLQQSRGYTEEKCRQMMENQLTEKEFLALSDFVLENSSTIEELKRQIAERMAKMEMDKDQ